MTLLNFDTELDYTTSRRIIREAPVEIPAPIPDQVKQMPSTQAAYLAKGEDAWDWRDLRDYVVREIESRWGQFPRNVVKESGIFKSFCSRWGEKAVPIARAVFEGQDGMWMGAPVSINRFTIKSDPYFASVIEKQYLAQSGQALVA